MDADFLWHRTFFPQRRDAGLGIVAVCVCGIGCLEKNLYFCYDLIMFLLCYFKYEQHQSL